MIDHLETFLRLLFPWETEHLRLYKSIMWKFVPSDPTAFKGPPLANYAAQDFLRLKQLIQSRIRPFQDVWICLATQRAAVLDKTSKDGFQKAMRQIPNAVSWKSIWLDIDVKPGAYATQDDAALALGKFIIACGLPYPTMIVRSGSGGMHVYWCTVENMTIEMWRALATSLQQAAIAKGLTIDPQVTVNPVGVLRVPTSFNWKSGTPLPVDLVVPEDESFPIYSYDQLTTALSAYGTNISGVKAAGGTTYTKNFTANVGGSAAPIPLADLELVCPLTADTVVRGGDGDPEPLWSQMMLLASFTDDPIGNAHILSKGDARYSQVETDRKIQEKINARANNPALGWPSCASFATLNPHCRTCPFNGQGKSPFNFVNRSTPQPGATPQPGDDLVPSPYWRGQNCHVYRVFSDDKGNPVNIDLLGHKVIDAYIDQQANQLVFKTNIMRAEVWVSVPAGSSSQASTLMRALGQAPNGGINIPVAKYSKVRDFIVAWVTHLQEQKRIIVSSNYGWSPDMTSFTFGDKTFTPGGEKRSYMHKAFDKNFQEVGKLQPWLDALALVKGRPELEIVVASSFAAPLTALVGSASSVLSIYSAASGIGKSTAMRIAQAVWGHPVQGMSSLDDTANAVKKKIADIQSLPAYWDELITSDATDRVVDLVFSFTQGKAKSRLTQNSERMEANAFVTMFALASNHGVSSRLYQDTSGTEAGGLRIFEVEAQFHQPSHPLGVANQLVSKLSTNFGCAGVKFAEQLINDRQTVQDTLDKVAQILDAQCNFTSKERYWRVTMVVILAGAILSNLYGLTTFDPLGILQCLTRELQRQRGRLQSKSHITMSSPTSALELLNELQMSSKGKNLITTEYVPLVGAGRPTAVKLVDTDVTKLGDVWVQMGALDGRYRMRVSKFDIWCMERKHNPENILKLLGKNFTILRDRLTIGAGVPMYDSTTHGLSGRSWCYDLTPLTSSGADHSDSD